MLFVLQVIHHMYQTLEYDFDEIRSALASVSDRDSLEQFCDAVLVEVPRESEIERILTICNGPKLESAIVVSEIKLTSEEEEAV